MIDLIAQHVAHLRATGKAARTIEEREKVLRRLDADLPCGVNEATVEELENWLGNDLFGRQCKATYFGHIVGYYRWASSPDRPVSLEWDPSAGLVRPRVPEGEPRPISTEQLTQARANLTQPWRLYVELAAFAGLRCIEIARLDRVDVTKETLTVRRGKGDKRRVVPTAGDLWRAIQPLPPGPVARTLRGTRWAERQLSSRTAEHLDRIGLEDVTLHRCRSWYATYLLDEGAEITSVQRAMGHASLKTTAVYLQFTSKQRARLLKATDALPALAPVPC